MGYSSVPSDLAAVRRRAGFFSSVMALAPALAVASASAALRRGARFGFSSAGALDLAAVAALVVGPVSAALRRGARFGAAASVAGDSAAGAFATGVVTSSSAAA